MAPAKEPEYLAIVVEIVASMSILGKGATKSHVSSRKGATTIWRSSHQLDLAMDHLEVTMSRVELAGEMSRARVEK